MSLSRLDFVIPARDSACWLAHAVESCLKQTYPNVGIIVVDDASTDSTPKLMDFLCGRHPQIQYLRVPERVGRSVARNLGNQAAAGEFIAVLDADDIAYPKRAQLSVSALQNADFVHGSCEYIDALGNKLVVQDRYGRPQEAYFADVFDKGMALSGDMLNYIVHSTAAYKREVAVRFPYRGGDYAALGLDDWAFELDVAFSGLKMDHIPVVIGAYRNLESGISKQRDPEKVKAVKTAFLESLKVSA